jgi:hypothetical protein
MMRSLRLCLAVAPLAAGAAHAQLQQVQIGAPPALEVQRIAPQLVGFAGSEVNFENLVNGLSLGLPVTLTTPVSAGVTQVVSFTPSGTMTPTQIALTLENARQVAIANGIAAPTAQQLGIILNGGALPTALGNPTVTGLIGGPGTVTTSLATRPSIAAQLQATPRFSRSDSPLPRGISDTPLVPPVSASTPGLSSTSAATAAPAPRAPSAATGGSAGVPRWGATR